VIQTLIDKIDNMELIRDKIAEILLTESASQVVLATTAGKPSPDDWKLRIFLERSNPWEAWLNGDTDRTPIINVWFDNENFNESGGGVVDSQKTTGFFNIDCYAYGKSSANGAGHKPGDREAALEAHKALRLVRNILMDPNYTYLGLRGTVWQRWPQSATTFQPQQDTRSVQQIVAARLVLRVVYNENTAQITGDTLEVIGVTVKRASTGEVLLLADFQH